MPKSKTMELAIKIAGKVDKSLGTSVKTSSKQLDTIVKAANKVSNITAAGLAAMGAGAVAATKYLSDLGDQWQKATNQVAASTGAAGAQLEKLRGVMEQVYGDNFGEDITDVADAVALVDRNMERLSQNGMVKAAEAALALRDTFGYDVAETTRAAEAIRKNFNVSAEKAFDLIATGAQNGLDYSGELLDTLSEYSVQFAKLGLSADAMFQILQSGADSTAWNLDKVGDAVKEFSIRAIDGSDTTLSAFEALGYDAGEMMATFAAGGEKANRAFFQVLDRLLEMDDQVQRDAVGVKLFGTMWEDLGVDALRAMANASTAAYGTGEALEQINQTRYNDLDSALEGVRRRLEVSLLPAADAVYQALMEHTPEITAALDEMSPIVAEMAGDFSEMASTTLAEGLPRLAAGLRDFSAWAAQAYDKAEPLLAFLWKHKGTVAAFAVALRLIGPAINTVTKAMAAYKSAKTFFALLQASGKLGQIATIFKAVGAALAGPLGIVLAIAAGLLLLYKNWDTAKAALEQFGAMGAQAWAALDAAITNGIAAIGEKFPLLGAYLSGWWQSIQAAVGNVQTILADLLEFVDNVFSGNWAAAWQNIVNIFGNLFGLVGNLAKAPINGVIALINKAIEGVNSLSVTIPDWVPGVGGKTLGFQIPTIPQLAEGGIATRPTLAEIGEGGEPEAVMPLSKLAALLDEWTKKPGPSGSGGGAVGDGITYAPVFHFHGSTPTQEEAQEVGRLSFAEFKRLYQQMKAEERRKNFRAEPAF